MAHSVGWSREDLERLQPVDVSPWNGLHPAPSQSDHQSRPQQQQDDTSRNWQEMPIPYSPPEKILSPFQPPVQPLQHGDAKEPAKILGLRKTTFFLTLSNILLAVGLVVLGVVQSRVSSSPAGGLDTQQSSCSGSTSLITGSATSTSTAAAATGSTDNGKICFDTDRSITSAVALGDVIPECPLPEGSDVNYTVPGTNLTFARVCETDYPSQDMAQFPVLTMLDCIHLCAQLNLYPASARGRCMGVSWVYADGPQGTGLSFCYPKSAMNESNRRAATESAVLLVD
ncbi:hypothetical protein N658DRAFT_500287 [Parathielavia hyrcaniae]|uniref:Uncharacterized protein n=1 Tax=Parathielavia hyrcaniae TaxID=113614 RepID=A0AAN6PY16_9PEZI|nr:hypothetical protein N658DRAFT_500287 [Parathielavia hyrcaniae]